MTMKKEKLTIKVLIENDQIFTDEFNLNQKVQVIVNKISADLKIDAEGRELRHEDGQPIEDLTKAIEDINIQDGECLRFFKKSTKPDRDKGFA